MMKPLPENRCRIGQYIIRTCVVCGVEIPSRNTKTCGKQACQRAYDATRRRKPFASTHTLLEMRDWYQRTQSERT